MSQPKTASGKRARKRSSREKLTDYTDLPRTAAIDGTKTRHWGEGTFVIPAPREVDAAMRQVESGDLTTIDAIRAALAEKHGATIACPLTTGIFAWIAAHAAAESEAEGSDSITPYWRTLKARGELNPKYPGGIENLRQRLENEGHTIVQRGKRFFVADFERCLASVRF